METLVLSGMISARFRPVRPAGRKMSARPASPRAGPARVHLYSKRSCFKSGSIRTSKRIVKIILVHITRPEIYYITHLSKLI